MGRKYFLFQPEITNEQSIISQHRIALSFLNFVMIKKQYFDSIHIASLVVFLFFVMKLLMYCVCFNPRQPNPSQYSSC